MPLQIPTGYGLAAWHFGSTQGTPEFVTTCGVDVSDAAGDFVQVANELFDYYKFSILAETSSAVQLTKVSISVGQDGEGSSVDSSNAAVAGAKGSGAAPMAMSAIARKVTNLGGRKGRGRMFLPGTLQQTDVNAGGHIDATKATNLSGMLDLFWSWCAGGDSSTSSSPHPLVLLHSGPETPTVVSNLALGPIVGWIHGRIW